MLRSLYIWPDRPLLSLLVLLVLAMPFLYLAREPMHTLYSNAVGKDHRLLAEWFELEPAVELLPKGARLDTAA